MGRGYRFIACFQKAQVIFVVFVGANLYFITLHAELLLMKGYDQTLHFLTRTDQLQLKTVHAKLGQNVSLSNIN